MRNRDEAAVDSESRRAPPFDRGAKAPAPAEPAALGSGLSEVLPLASHELQAPLRKIAGFCEPLRQRLGEGRTDPETVDLVDRIERMADEMRQLVAGLLELARASDGAVRPELVALDEAFAAALAGLRGAVRETGAAIEAERLPSVVGDRAQLARLLQCLLSNALKFHRPGEPPRVRVSGREWDGFVEVVIADDGVGFDPRHAHRLFKPFQRLHSRKDFEGRGVELALCAAIAARHGGSVSASGRPGGGSRFVVTLAAVRTERGNAHGS